MNQLEIISKQEVLGKNFVIYGDVENPLFLAKDVAEWIEYGKTSQGFYDTSAMLRTIEEPEKIKMRTTINNPSGSEMWFLTEDGLYEILMQSRKPIAKQFKTIVKQILKDVRKHGMYAKEEILENPDLLIEIATQLKKEREQRKLLQTQNSVLEQKVSEYEPKAQYVDLILQSKGTLTITQIAADYGLTANKLNKILYEERIQRNVGGQWILYKEHMNLGYTKSETINFTHSDGRPDTKLNTRWMQKGRLLIHTILESRGIYANMDRRRVG